MAVKQKRLLRHRERADSCILLGDRSTTFEILGGKGGNGVAIHLPSLQQNDGFSPSRRRARHLLHILDHVGGRHLLRLIAVANLDHQGCCLSSTDQTGVNI